MNRFTRRRLHRCQGAPAKQIDSTKLTTNSGSWARYCCLFLVGHNLRATRTWGDGRIQSLSISTLFQFVFLLHRMGPDLAMDSFKRDRFLAVLRPFCISSTCPSSFELYCSFPRGFNSSLPKLDITPVYLHVQSSVLIS